MRSRYPHGTHQIDNGQWPDQWMMTRLTNDGQTVRIVLILDKRSKIHVFIPRVCRTYTTLFMSLVKTYLDNSLKVISENILEVCRILHTIIFHSKQSCIIFNSKLSSLKIKFDHNHHQHSIIYHLIFSSCAVG